MQITFYQKTTKFGTHEVQPHMINFWCGPRKSDDMAATRGLRFWGPHTKFLNGHISAPIYARIMCYSLLELLSCIEVFVLCELSPQMNIWRSFYVKHQNYGGSHIWIQYGYHKRAQIFEVHIKNLLYGAILHLYQILWFSDKK